VPRPFNGRLGIVTQSEGAQTTLHWLRDDDAPRHAGEYFSQMSTLHPDEKDQTRRVASGVTEPARARSQACRGDAT
jgi:hypothetical protein